MDRIVKNKEFLARLQHVKSNKKQRNSQLQHATAGEVCSICELVKNLLHNPSLQVKLNSRQRTILRKHQRSLKSLINRSVSQGKKKKILQTGGGGFLLPLILGLVGPAINKLLRA